MTKINKLVLSGFKSFAKKTELVFCDKFNCVLGPNGSGKSNILDSLCFVLGKSSSKSLRAEKSANLIYNGGKKKNPAKDATVTIYFDNSSGIFQFETPEVKVSRTVRQDGSSRYKINDKTVTRSQLVELLGAAKINPDGHNIILQGDIVQLIEMSSIDRRKIIEEIAGISIYEEKKQKALNELNKVEEKLKEVDIILVERQTYLKELKKERNQALKFKELNEKIKRNKATILHMNMKGKKDKKSTLAKQIETVKSEIEKYNQAIEKCKKEKSNIQSRIQKINKEIEEKGDKDQVRIQKEVEELRVNIATNKTQIGSCENELVRVDERNHTLDKSMSDLNEKIDRLHAEKVQLGKNVKSNQDMIEKLNTKIGNFKKKHKLGDNQNLEGEIAEIDSLADSKQVEIQGLRQEQQELLREKDRLEYQVDGFDQKIVKIKEIEQEHKTELDKLKSTKEEFKKTTVELNKLLNEDSSLAAQLANARNKILKIKEEIAKLRAQSAGLKERMSGNMATQKILALKSKITGIHGTVSELGTVSNKYSTALEIAAGPRIRSIIVDSDKTASECINYLKKNKLGVASFLPLNKIRPSSIRPEHKAITNGPGVHGFAIDLIKFDARFKNAFSYVLGSTIIVEDLGVARQIGVGKIRMVTLDGDLTELSGAMHGGFRRKGKGLSFQEKEVSQGLENLESEEGDLQNIITTLEKRKQENEESIQRLRELKANLEVDIIKIEKVLHVESEDLGASKEKKKNFMTKIKEADAKLREIQNKINLANRDLAQAKMKKQKLRETILQLRNPTLIAELNTFEQKMQELREDNIKKNSEIKNIDVQLTTILEPEKEKTVKILKQHDKEKQGFADEIKRLQDKIKVQSKELKEKEAMQKKFYTEFKDFFRKRDKLNESVSQLDNTIYKKEEAVRDKERRMNNVSLDHAKTCAELSGLEEEYKEFEGIALFKDKPEETIKREIWQFEKMVNDLGAVNMRALEIYEAIEKEYKAIVGKKDTLETEREEVLLMMNEIESKKQTLFLKTFNVITENFRRIFGQLSTKGDAYLELEDPKTIFEGGLLIKVRLSGKKFLDIRSLSGGEKTMTALAFIFAVQEYEPASFYILDEVDAALDKKNSEKLAHLVRQYTSKAQYVVISHNDGVISEADNLYGVSMDQHGISKVVSLRI